MKVPKAKRMTILKLLEEFLDRFFRMRDSCDTVSLDFNPSFLINAEKKRINDNNSNPPAEKNMAVFSVLPKSASYINNPRAINREAQALVFSKIIVRDLALSPIFL
jgi:hypothetical protein